MREGLPPGDAQASYGVDPQGSLQLDGQVVDENGVPVAGALVELNSNPPRQTQSNEDGFFYFDKLVARPYGLKAYKDNRFGSVYTPRIDEEFPPVTIRI